MPSTQLSLHLQLTGVVIVEVTGGPKLILFLEEEYVVPYFYNIACYEISACLFM